ncbi:type II toxin-antitoxin system VapC family toxin [Streptomyces sp. NPDC088553]|uniref:type II toxin-antitoxin system VapC family toxin n=1 Tax=Streptomyces sp. NPDC088553 TaxID=3365864 RepID=UPI0038012F5E
MHGTLLLDSEGLSRLHREDRTVLTLVQAAAEEGVRVATTVTTRVEADHDRVHPARIRWVLSRIDVHPVTRAVSDEAARLLREHRLHGHKHAIDATLAAVALSARAPVTVLTSDPEDLTLLCGPSVAIVKI